VAAVSLAVLVALLLVAWKVVGAFFTRIAPKDVLFHPRRRAIHEAVRERPGERLRDLQRRLDMAWGVFSFHLHVLVKTGHLVLRKEGAYTLALPIVPGERAAIIPHPVTRAVYDLLPPDGSPVPFPELRARLGFSRQRVNHHLHALESRGLVEVHRGPDGARGVSRRDAPPGGIGPT
jgi:predicted transcriptional regulator